MRSDEALWNTLGGDGFFEDEDKDEEEFDLASLDAIHDISVMATDWTTETIVSQLRRGTIDINPDFQRREAWTDSNKSKFIESLFLGLPVPSLVLAERRGERGHFYVIDGKQRLLSLWKFAAKEGEGFDQPLRLKNVPLMNELDGLSLEEIAQRFDLRDQYDFFQNQTIRTVVVKNCPPEVMYLLFHRLNTGSVKLSPQELRQALFPGPFTVFADKFSANSDAFREILNLDKPDFRMRDVELLVRYFAFRNFLSSYSGNLKDFLDSTCKLLNAKWAERETAIRDQAEELDRAIFTTIEVFGEDAFKKWNGKKFEQRFNRAVFDIMTLFFSQPRVIVAALEHKKDLKERFKAACETNSDFLTALQTTTKSVQATFDRLHTWAEILNDCLGVPIPQVVQAGGGIKLYPRE